MSPLSVEEFFNVGVIYFQYSSFRELVGPWQVPQLWIFFIITSMDTGWRGLMGFLNVGYVW